MAVDVRRVAASALGRDVRTATITGRTPIPYDPFLAGRVVERVEGSAVTGRGVTMTWQAVVKRTVGPGLRPGRRELAAYQLGIASPSSSEVLGAPRLLASHVEDGSVELWLETLVDVHGGRWPLERYGLAARHIAAWDAGASRIEPVVGLDAEAAWAERHGQPHRVSEAVATLQELRRHPAADEVMAVLDDSGFHRTESMIASTQARIEQLRTFPRTLVHHDLVRSNLFALADGSTAAIDWETVGPGPAGVDLAPLVVGSVRRGEAASDDLLVLEEVVLTHFVDELTKRGAAVSNVEGAYRLALGLRWHVVIGAIGAWLDPTSTRIRGSRPDEPRSEGLRHLMALSRHLLDSAVVDAA